MALNPSGAISLAGPTAGQSIAVELGVSATATISLNDTNVRTLAQVPSGVIVMPVDFWGKSNVTGRQKSYIIRALSTQYNIISNTGVISATATAAGSNRVGSAPIEYGTDVGMFAYGGTTGTAGLSNLINYVTNTGVLGASTPGVGTVRRYAAGANYGTDKGITAFSQAGSPSSVVSSISNLVSNTGVVASDTPGVGTARRQSAGANYGTDKAIFAFGNQGNPASSPATNVSNLVSNTGVVASDTPGVGTARSRLSATNYGTDKAIFAYGWVSTPTPINTSNLVSNTGVVASDTPGVGTGRIDGASSVYGGDKAIFAFGSNNGPAISVVNYVTNTGVIGADVSTLPSITGGASGSIAFSLTP
jgi:hypothetical protein